MQIPVAECVRVHSGDVVLRKLSRLFSRAEVIRSFMYSIMHQHIMRTRLPQKFTSIINLCAAKFCQHLGRCVSTPKIEKRANNFKICLQILEYDKTSRSSQRPCEACFSVLLHGLRDTCERPHRSPLIGVCLVLEPSGHPRHRVLEQSGTRAITNVGSGSVKTSQVCSSVACFAAWTRCWCWCSSGCLPFFESSLALLAFASPLVAIEEE